MTNLVARLVIRSCAQFSLSDKIILPGIYNRTKLLTHRFSRTNSTNFHLIPSFYTLWRPFLADLSLPPSLLTSSSNIHMRVTQWPEWNWPWDTYPDILLSYEEQPNILLNISKWVKKRETPAAVSLLTVKHQQQRLSTICLSCQIEYSQPSI